MKDKNDMMEAKMQFGHWHLKMTSTELWIINLDEKVDEFGKAFPMLIFQDLQKIYHLSLMISVLEISFLYSQDIYPFKSFFWSDI